MQRNASTPLPITLSLQSASYGDQLNVFLHVGHVATLLPPPTLHDGPFYSNPRIDMLAFCRLFSSLHLATHVVRQLLWNM